jgi:unsaturated rhamnogalacturonyl hydrolase
MARHFTKQEIEEIRSQLATHGVRDSEFPEITSVKDAAVVIALQDGVNVRIPLNLIEKRICDIIYSGGYSPDPDVPGGWTPELIEKLEGIEDNAQVNKIESISVNGDTQDITNKNVNILVPTELSQLSGDNTHRVVTDTEKQTWSEKYDKPNNGIPASDLASGVIPDVSAFITRTVDNLLYYYKKSEVDTMIASVQSFTFESVASLPAASSDTIGKIYLVPSANPTTNNAKDEFITVQNQGNYAWEQIGSTDIEISDYVTTVELDAALAAYATRTYVDSAKQKGDLAFAEVFTQNAADKVSVVMSKSTITMYPQPCKFRNNQDKWTYFGGFTFDSILKCYMDNNDSTLYNYVRTWYQSHTSTSGTGIVSPGGAYSKTDYNIDNIEPGKALLSLYAIDPDAKYRTAIETLIDQLADQPRTTAGPYYHKGQYTQQVWLDGLYMCEPFRTQYAATYLTGSAQAEVFDDICNQILVACEKTYDPVTGLYRHAWDESGAAGWIDPETNGQAYYAWGRALGWLMMAILDVLDWLPSAHSDRESLIEILRGLCDHLPQYADSGSGVWRILPTEPATDTRNVLESSSSSMFVYAYLKGIRKGYLPLSMLDYAKDLYGKVKAAFVTVNGSSMSISNCIKTGNPGSTSTTKEQVLNNYYSQDILSNDAHVLGAWIAASVEYEALFPGESGTVQPKKENLANKVTAVTQSSTDTNYPSAKAVYDFVKPAVATSQPSSGMLPNVMYRLGTLSGNTTFSLDTTNVDASVTNHYYWTFSTGSTVPTVTWPVSITKWAGGAAPELTANCYYEISVLDGVALYTEV